MKTQRAVRKKKPAGKRVLHRERTLIAQIMETSPAGITMVNRRGKVTFANRQAEKVLGLTKDEISQRTYNDPQWHITDFEGNPFPEDKLPFYQVMSTGQSVHNIRHTIEHPDGKRVLLSINAAPLFTKSKQVNGMVATIEDVTERVRAETTVQESEERIHRLSDITVEGIVIHEKGIILDANQALAVMFGYELSEIIGQYALNFFTPESGKVMMHNIMTDYEKPYEAMGIKKDGSIFPVEIIGKSTMYRGRKVRVGSVQDITERQRAEKALKESEESLKFSQQVAHVGHWTWDTTTNQVQWSDEMFRIFGLSPENFTSDLNKIIMETIHPDDRAKVLQANNLVLESQKPAPLEYRVVWPDQSVRTVWAVPGASVSDGSGRITKLIGIVQDITERKRAEEALKASEQKYRSIIETTSEWIWEIDINGKHTYSNHSIESILGYSIVEFLGAPAFNFMEVEDREKVKKELPDFIACKKGWRNWIIRWYHKNGTLRYLESNADPVLDSDGNMLGYRGSDRDITDRIKAGESLRQSEEKFRSLAESISDWIWEVDVNGRYIYSNPKVFDILGYKMEEVIGKTSFEFMKPDEAKRVAQQFKEAISTSQPFSDLENINIHKDGHEVVLETSGTPIFDDQHRLMGYRGIDRDITQRKLAIKTLQESEIMYRTIVENISDALYIHDFDGNIIDVNESACKMLGYTRSELVGAHLSKIDSEENTKYLPERMQRLLSENSIIFEGQHVKKDGTLIPIEASAKMVTKEGKGIIQGFARDITGRKRAEKALEESGKRMRAIIDHAPFGAHSYELYTDGRLIFKGANKSADRILGFKHSTIIGKTIEEAFPGLADTQVPGKYRRVANTGELYADDQIEYDEGKIKRAFEIQAFQTAQSQMSVFFRDVTERKLAEEALKNASIEWQTTFDAASDAICVLDMNQNILRANKSMSELFPSYSGQLVGRHCWEIVHGTSKPIEGCPILRMTKTHCRESMELQKGDKWFEVTVDPILDSIGNLTGAVHIVRDITERKRVESMIRTQRDLAMELNSVINLEAGLRLFLGAALRLSGMDCGGIYIVDETTGALNLLVHQGLSDEFVTATSHYEADSASVQIILEGKPIYTTHSRLGTPLDETRNRENLQALAVIPIHHEDKIIACLNIASRTAPEVPIFARETLETVASQIGSTIARLKVRKALEVSEKKYRSVVDSIQDVLYRSDKNGRLIMCSPSGVKMFGYSSVEEMLLKPVESFMQNPSARELMLSKMNEAGIFYDYEGTLVRKDGTTFIASISTHLYYDESGELQGTEGMIRDITERKQAEELLRVRIELLEYAATHSLAELLQKTLDEVDRLTNSPIGFYHFVEADQKTLSLQAWSTRTIKEFCTAEGKGMHYNIDEAGVWVDCVRQRKPVIHNDYASLSHRKGMPEGHAKVIRELVVPILRGNRIVAILGVGNKPTDYVEKDVALISYLADVAWEITQRKRTEVALSESEEKFRSLAEQSPNMIFINKQGRVIYANAKCEEIIGYTKEEFYAPDFNFLKITSPEFVELVKEKYNLHQQGEEVIPYEYALVTKYGKRVNAIIATKLIDYGNDKAILGIITDITERKQAEEEKEKLQDQLLQAQKMDAIGQLAGGIAHDFNNMIGVILGYAVLIEKQLEPSSTLTQKVKAIIMAAERSANLTKQLLGFARKQITNPIVLNLNDELSTLQKMLNRLIGEDIDLQIRTDQELWNIKIDPVQIDQILTNLATNARDAIENVGVINIETSNIAFDPSFSEKNPEFVPGEYVMLAFSDTGKGMDRTTQGHIFEPFFTTKPKGKGTGLGLATLFGIVKQNNGYINVYSEPGKGTTFKIYFPRHFGESETPLTTQEELSLVGIETILVVEDEEQLLQLTMSTLKTYGYMVFGAKSPREAISLCLQTDKKIDLLITDVIMPEMNGKELKEQLDAIKPGMKTIFMSGYTADVVANRGIVEEGLEFLQKPFSPFTLAKKVRNVLNG